MVPRRPRSVELKVCDVFHVGRDVLVGGVNKRLVEVDKQDELSVLEQSVFIFLAQVLCFLRVPQHSYLV